MSEKKITIVPTRNNIIVENPVKPRKKSALQLTPEMEAKAEAEWSAEQLQKAEKATVLAAGVGCVEVSEGDVVKLKTGRFLSAEPLEGGKFLLFTEGDVMAIYKEE
jgi:co-chaperonin GroES (HSP10)